MADRIRYVDTASSAGGNGTTQAHTGTNRAYPTLDAALAAEKGDITTFGGNLVINCAGSIADTADTFAWAGGGWVSDATHKLIIQGDATAPDGDGVNLGAAYSNSFYRLEGVGTTGVFRNLGVDVALIGLQFGFNSATGGIACLELAPATQTSTVDRCRIKMLTGSPGSTCVGISIVDGVSNVTNTTVEWANANNCPAIQCAATLGLTNCTISNAVFGLYASGGTATVKNCVVFNCNDDFLIGSTLVGSFIAHDDAAETGETNHIDISPGGVEATDWAAAFAGYTTGDFRVKNTSSVLYNAGTNTGAPATDLIGTTRPQATTVDIGAWEFTTGSTAVLINLNSAVVDNGLADIVTHGTKVHVCSALPTDYADTLTKSLGNATVSFGSPAASAAGDGRKITSAAIVSTGSITATGTVSHWAVLDLASGGRLLAAGPIDVPEAVTSGMVFSLGAMALVLPRG